MTLDSGLKHPGLVALINACDIELPGGQKLALIALARCRDGRTGRSTISLDTIGRRSGLSGKQAGRHIDALVACGLVARVGRVGKCSVYAINTPALAESETSRKPAAGPVDNSSDTPDICDTDPGHSERSPRTFATLTPDMGVRHSGYCSEMDSEGGSEAQGRATEPAQTPPPSPSIPEDLKTGQPEQPADAETASAAIDADLLAAVNAQRAANGKREPVNLADLVQQSGLAGITPAAAAQWILARSTRNFFRADWYRPEAAGQPALLDEAAKRKARAQADAVQAALLQRSIEAMRAPALMPQPASRPTSTPTPRRVAAVGVGAVTGTGWAQRAVARFSAGEAVSHATISSAAAALGLSLADLKAQRARLAVAA